MTTCMKYYVFSSLSPSFSSCFQNFLKAKCSSATGLWFWHSYCSFFFWKISQCTDTNYMCFFHATMERYFHLKKIPSTGEHDNAWKDTDNTDNTICELNYLTHSFYCARHCFGREFVLAVFVLGLCFPGLENSSFFSFKNYFLQLKMYAWI